MSEEPPPVVAIGDFVRSTLIGRIVGFVVDIRPGRLGRDPATIVHVQCSDGRIEYVVSQYIDVVFPAAQWDAVKHFYADEEPDARTTADDQETRPTNARKRAPVRRGDRQRRG